MLGRALIGSLLITLLTSPSIAAEGEHLVVRNKQECYKALAAVESQLYKRVKAKTLDEEQIDELNLILDDSDQYCFEGKVKKAKKKLMSAIEIILTSPAEKVD